MCVTAYFKSLFSLQSNYTANFDPEIVIVDSDPETGILTQNFILTYTLSSAAELQLNKSLGRVDIRDPFETVQVCSHTFGIQLDNIINKSSHCNTWHKHCSISSKISARVVISLSLCCMCPHYKHLLKA